MKPGVYRFKDIEEQNEYELQHWLDIGLSYDEIDRYEYARLRYLPKAYRPGVYRYKNLKEKENDEFKRVMEAWNKSTNNE
jgi:hypothetical protein